MDSVREVVKRIRRLAIREGNTVRFRRCDLFEENLDEILKLSKRLEPIEPVVRYDYVGDISPNKCPNCDGGVIGFPFCPRCGQALIWGGEK